MIRLANSGDAQAVAEIYEPIVSRSAISFELVAPTEAEMAARIASTLAGMPWLVYERAGEVVGYAYGSRHRERAAYQWSVDVSVYVGASARRQGIGRALYLSLLGLLRLQGFYTAHAGITLPNPGSVRLHESLGFRAIGIYPAVGYKLSAWHDVGWWQLALRERVGQPLPPIPCEQAQKLPEWNAALACSEKL